MSIATEIRLRIKAEGEAVLQGLGDKLKKIAANATASSPKFRVLAGELRKIESTAGRSTTLLKQYSASWRELAGAVDIASKEFKEATAESARLDAQIAKAEGRNRKAGSRLKTGAQVAGTAVAAGIFGGPEAAIGAVAGGIAGGVPGAQVGAAAGATVSQLRQALGATAAYEAEIKKLQIALKGVTTSQIEYNDALKFIQTSTDNYAVTQDILTRQFTKLQASVQGSGGSLQDTKIVFDGIVSAVRATGGSLQDVDSALTATAQVFSKGKVSAEELRQQIGERLPGAFTLFAKSMDMTPQQLDKALEGGKVSLKDFMVFAKDLFDRYGENAKIIADSPAAAGDRLQIALSNLNKSVGSLLQPLGAMFQDTFTGIADNITRATNALNNFFGLSGDAMVKGNTVLINQINKNIATRKELIRLGKGDVQIHKQTIADQEAIRETLRSQINDQTRSLVVPTENSKGLPGIDPDAGKDKKGGRGATAAANALAASKERTEVLKQETATIDKIAAFQEKINNATRIGNQQAALTLAYEQDRAKIQGEFGKQMEKLAQTDNRGEEAKALLSKTQAQLEALALDNRGKMTALKLQESAAGYQTLTQLQQEDLIAKQILAGKGEEARLQVEIANTIRDVKDPALRATLAKQIRANAEAKKELTLAKNLKQIYTDLGMTIKDGVIGAIQGAIDGTKSLGEAAVGVLKNIANKMLDIAVNMALFGSISGTGTGGGLLGGLFLAKGGVFAQNGIQPFARGGIVNKPTIFPFANGTGLMGEAGPEAIMPLRRGRDGNLGVMSSGGGTTNVVVNVDASGSSVEGDQSQAKALGNAISAAVQSELVKQKRPGGLLA
jgi:tape measure domain-containing protein